MTAVAPIVVALVDSAVRLRANEQCGLPCLPRAATSRDWGVVQCDPHECWPCRRECDATLHPKTEVQFVFRPFFVACSSSRCSIRCRCQAQSTAGRHGFNGPFGVEIGLSNQVLGFTLLLQCLTKCRLEVLLQTVRARIKSLQTLRQKVGILIVGCCCSSSRVVVVLVLQLARAQRLEL